MKRSTRDLAPGIAPRLSARVPNSPKAWRKGKGKESPFMRSPKTTVALPYRAAGMDDRHAANVLTQLRSSSASPGLLSSSSSSPSSSRQSSFDLDFSPQLGFLQRLFLVILGVLSFSLPMTTLLCLKPVTSFAQGFLYGVLSLFCGSLALWLGRYALRERIYQRRFSKTPQEAADPDSKFEKVQDITIHYKLAMPKKEKDDFAEEKSPVELAIHCAHGFGANTYSWQSVMKDLATQSKAMVVAHDTPGFGLTERPKDIDKFTLRFASELTLGLMNAVAAETNKLIFMGHSMGSISASYSALRHFNERQKKMTPLDSANLLILVAPAVIASKREPRARKKNNGRTILGKRRVLGKWILLLGRKLSLFIVQPFLLLILRSLVSSKAFWQQGLSAAWFNKSKLTPEAVDGYRKAKIMKEWDKGLVKFVFAMLFSMQNTRGRDELLMDLREAAEKGLRVLIIHGEQDRIVPVTNSLKLAEMIPNCKVEIVPRCGHLPHEEYPEMFIDIVSDWINR